MYTILGSEKSKIVFKNTSYADSNSIQCINEKIHNSERFSSYRKMQKHKVNFQTGHFVIGF